VNSARTGIIGGSGLYELDGLEVLDRLSIDTPFGPPSDELLLARLHGQEIVFLPRHGRGHRLPPHQINYRANIYALKLAGVTRILSVSAVGSLRLEIPPGDFVLVDQFVDRTHGRSSTFFDGPVVAHVSMADPVCPGMRASLLSAAQASGISMHPAGTYIAMQGPQFSSRAESNLYRSWGMDIIGMTNMPEAKLAREAEICYSTVAMSTDYDCWHEEEDAVSVTSVIEVMHANVDKAKRLLDSWLSNSAAAESGSCSCHRALEHGIFADLKAQPDEALRPIHALVERFL